jgi:hypothetical protein
VILSFFELHLSSLVNKIFPGCCLTTGTPVGDYYYNNCCLVLDPLTLLERLYIVALWAAFISSNLVTDYFFVFEPIWEEGGGASLKDSRKLIVEKVSASNSDFNWKSLYFGVMVLILIIFELTRSYLVSWFGKNAFCGPSSHRNICLESC